jgi:predicted Rossmann-fold nucleotide-binding protein
LPGHRPKSANEDPDAPSRLRAILESPSYILPEQDIAFLARDETRGVRLQIEYIKPETLLQEHGIRGTVVVYGSTRILEPDAARRNVETARQTLETDPRDSILIRKLAVAERILAKSRYYEVAREFGRLVGSCCDSDGSRLVIMTGGGPGMMEAANRGAFEVGAKSVGLNIDELFEVLTLVQTRKIKPVPIVLVGEEYWRRAVDVEFLADEGTIDAEDRELFWFAETANEIWGSILDWYDACGAPLGLRS